MKLSNALTAVALAASAMSSQAADIFRLDFDALLDDAQVGDYYNGNGGPSYGTVFTGDSRAVKSIDFGGNGNFAGQPSGENALYFVTSTVVVDVAIGFENALSFAYTGNAANIKVFGKVGNTFVTLFSSDLTAPPNCDDGDHDNCNWSIYSVEFSGVAYRLEFGGQPNKTLYDNITFGYKDPIGILPPPVPEPSTYGLMLLGLAGLGAVARRRRD